MESIHLLHGLHHADRAADCDSKEWLPDYRPLWQARAVPGGFLQQLAMKELVEKSPSLAERPALVRSKQPRTHIDCNEPPPKSQRFCFWNDPTPCLSRCDFRWFCWWKMVFGQVAILAAYIISPVCIFFSLLFLVCSCSCCSCSCSRCCCGCGCGCGYDCGCRPPCCRRYSSSFQLKSLYVDVWWCM